MSTALVTGASSGIGAAFVAQLAAERAALVLVARNPERLESLATELRERYKIAVEVLPADLSTEDGTALVEQRLRSVEDPIDLLINNAGFGLYGSFEHTDLAAEQRMLDLNVRAVLRLTLAVLPGMVRRHSGQILNVSSVAGFLPRGNAPTYAASKAWVTTFTESLAAEYGARGVQLCAVCPGFTHTDFHDRAGLDMSAIKNRMWLDADQVAAEGLKDLRAGRVVSIPGAQYKAMLGASRLVPRRVLAKLVGRK